MWHAKPQRKEPGVALEKLLLTDKDGVAWEFTLPTNKMRYFEFLMYAGWDPFNPTGEIKLQDLTKRDAYDYVYWAN